jgi:ribosomal protein S18 acetylase RimI-like enzyme
MTIRTPGEHDIPDIARVHVQSWRTSYRGIVPDSFLAALTFEKHEERHRRYMARPDAIYFVAESPTEGIVGFLSGGRERSGEGHFSGEIYAIYILAEHRRHGIGSALVYEWSASLRRASVNRALVWVLEGNLSARSFYERLGSRFLREQAIEIGGASLKELAYGWDDLSGIPARGCQLL